MSALLPCGFPFGLLFSSTQSNLIGAKMKYSEIKVIKSFCESLDSSPDWREVISEIANSSDDFEVDNVRFINSDSIDEIMQDEMQSDEYILGCFNTWVLSDVTGIDAKVFEAMQKAEAYEAIGKLVISMGKLSELQKQYIRHDGYGAHFNSWDGSEEEIHGSFGSYYVFDNR